MAKSNGLSGAGPISRPRHVQVDPYSVPKNYADADGVERFSTTLGEWQKIDKPKEDPSYKPSNLEKTLELLSAYTRKYGTSMSASVGIGILIQEQLPNAARDERRVVKIFDGIKKTLGNALETNEQMDVSRKAEAQEILRGFYLHLPTRHIAEEFLGQLGLEFPVED